TVIGDGCQIMIDSNAKLRSIQMPFCTESINGLYKAEVIHRKSWKNRAEAELSTLTWVDWYNNRRLLGRLGHIPPAEAEKAYYASIRNDDLAA
uniref:integrase core domain-containing protein n=1 Tax=Escherichia coli TaxID=562 RepID=UPI0021584AE3